MLYKARRRISLWRIRLNSRALCVFAIVSLLLYTCIFYFKGPEGAIGDHRDGNYFANASAIFKEVGLLIDTPTCSIPDFSPFSLTMRRFFKVTKPLEDCHGTHYNWTYIRGDMLVVNREQVEKDGYSLYKGFCQYKVISRVTLPKKSGGELKDADQLIRYSDSVSIDKEETEINHEFIMVECGRIKFPAVAVPYRAFHGKAAISSESSKSQMITKKIDFWKNRKPDEVLPPNVIIFGLDSTSRLNFRRNMFETKAFLESVGAVEMNGYVKVGENTFPNWARLAAGYSEDELKRICYFTRDTPQDECPYIWKRFDQANYLTAHSEDSPTFAIFNFMKAGFREQPTDFYLRPLFQAAHDFGHPPLYVLRSESRDCIEYQTNDELLLSYAESVLDFAHKHKTPVYSATWSTDQSHNDANGIQLLDNLYASLLSRLQKKGMLDNTILIFMGDHGYRYGKVKETLQGFYEDRLPNMWVKLPDWIIEELPDWKSSLDVNSRRLTSPHSLYWTLNLILETFSGLPKPEDATDFKTGKIVPRKPRQTFFEEVPLENICFDVGVPPEFCPCYIPDTLQLNDPVLVKASEVAIAKINKGLSYPCSQLSVGRISSGAALALSKVLVEGVPEIQRIIVAFTTSPGDYRFEAEVNYFSGNKSFSTSASVQRTSKVNRKYTACIKDAKLELFCYCL